MANERKITLIIDAKNTEAVKAVKQLENELDRMKTKGGQSSGMFASGFAKFTEQIRSSEIPTVQKMGSAVDGLESALSSSSRMAGIAGAAFGTMIVGLGAGIGVVTALTKKAYDLSSSFSEYGVSLGKVVEQTGFSTEAISALKLAAEENEMSFTKVSGALRNFQKLLIEAESGSDKAQAKLKLLGLNAPAALKDVDGAFAKTIQKINDASAGVDRNKLAFAAFGSKIGSDVIPLIVAMNGSLEDAKTHTEKLGLMMSHDAVKAAQDFDDAVDTTTFYLKGLGLTVGREVAPVFTSFFSDLNRWAIDNRVEIRSWAASVANSFKFAVGAARGFWAIFAPVASFTKGIIGAGYSVIPDLTTLEDKLKANLKIPTSPQMGRFYDKASSKNDFTLGGDDDFGGSRGGGKSGRSFTQGLPLHKDAQDVFNRFDRLMNSQPQFLTKLNEMADRLNTQPEWILNVMAFESRLKGDAKNPNSSATGLIQFMKNAGSGYNYGGMKLNRDQLAAMSETEQLSLVEAYLQPFTNRLVSQSSVYAAVAAGRIASDFSVLFKKGSEGYAKNRVWDANRDGNITQAELGMLASQFGFGSAYKIPRAARSGNVQVGGIVPDAVKAFMRGGFGGEVSTSGSVSGSIGQRATLPENILEGLTKAAPMLVDEMGGGDPVKRIAEMAAYWKSITDFSKEQKTIQERKAKLFADESTYLTRFNLMYEDQVTAAQETLQSLGMQFDVQQKLLQNDEYRAQYGDAMVLREKIALNQENFDLETRIARLQDTAAERYKRAWLGAIYDVRDANIRAVEDQINAQVKLDDAAQLHGQQVRARVLRHMADQKTLSEAYADGINSIYDKLLAKMNGALGKFGDIPILGDLAKFGNQQIAKKITGTLLDGLFPGLKDAISTTDNPIASPIVEKIIETNKLLKSMGGNASGIPAIANAVGGSGGDAHWLTTLLGGLTGGSANTTGGAVAGSLPSFGSMAGNGFPGGSQSIFGNIRQLFGTGEGGLFAPRQNILTGENSQLAGYIAGAGGIASMVGGLIGGRAGSVLQGIGTGAQLGAMFGPIGAGVGAAIGGIVGWLNDPKKKIDKNENMPKLQQGFQTSITEFQKLVADMRQMKIDDVDGALTQGGKLRSDIASGFGIQFGTKKYRSLAQQQIAQQLALIDRVDPQSPQNGGLMQQLQYWAAKRREAMENSNKFVATFANGGYTGNFGRNQIAGLVHGQEFVFDAASTAYYGRENLERMQKNRTLDDVSRSVGNKTSISIGAGSAPTVQMGNIVLQGVYALPDAKGWIESPDGAKQVISIIREHAQNTPQNADGLARDLARASR